MNLLVIGATGRTGQHVLTQGLQRGHAITAFTRRPTLLEHPERLTRVVRGDALNATDLAGALEGQDAVLSIISTSGIVRTLSRAMREAGVHRLVMTSSRSVVATRPKLPVTLAWLMFREIYADLARAEGLIEASGLDWSLVRAGMLTNKPFTGRVHTDFAANATGGELTLTRADYAMTLLDVLEDPSMIGRAVGVGGVRASARTNHPHAA